MRPKYLEALDLRNAGKTYREIASILGVKLGRVKEYLYKARHLDKKLAQHRDHDRRWYARHKAEVSAKKKAYWKKHQARLRQERLTTKINGKYITFYHLQKRPRPETCELCQRPWNMLFYHHWYDTNVNKGLWLCRGCHNFAERVEKGQVETYHQLKRVIEALKIAAVGEHRLGR